MDFIYVFEGCGEKMSLVIAAISKDNDIVVCADSRIVDKNGNIPRGLL